MTRYYIVCEGAGERERLDWTYDRDEAEAWMADYIREDDEVRAQGAPVPAYEYSIVEEEEDEEEDGEPIPFRTASQLRELGLSERDFL